jgi:hypothetical protein
MSDGADNTKKTPEVDKAAETADAKAANSGVESKSDEPDKEKPIEVLDEDDIALMKSYVRVCSVFVEDK